MAGKTLDVFRAALASEEPDVQEAARLAAAFVSRLGGGAQEAAEPAGFFERGGFDDFSLWRVVLGYGIPTLAAIALATITFCLRDL